MWSAEADWVIEAVVENLDVKRRLMERIDALCAPTTIVTTNTSGIPIHSIAEGRSESFRQHFMGTHFFNPPRYLKLLELIPTRDTLPEVVDTLRRFGEYRLGRASFYAKIRPTSSGTARHSAPAPSPWIISWSGYTVEKWTLLPDR
jgi:3-hydroxyacyl-CoA dehydrogenase